MIPIELTRDTFKGLLDYNSKNSKHTILKLTANWCRPCKTIKDLSIQQVANLSNTSIECYEIDVDESLDFYAFMKQKRMVNGIPVFLFYKKGNLDFAPDDSVTGANPPDILSFFARCAKI
jgi:thiol-disulfide isomerase/thioredoxin